MARNNDDRRIAQERTPADESAADKGGYGERNLSEEVSAEEARNHAAQLENAPSGASDTQGIVRTDVPHSSSRSPHRESLTDD
jgi:hypothetical protein